jgi:hypothetical protein
MSRHPNGADETSSASGGPLNNPLADNEENERKHQSLGPLQQSDSGEAENPAAADSSPDDPASSDSSITMTSASGALNDDDDDNNDSNAAEQQGSLLSNQDHRQLPRHPCPWQKQTTLPKKKAAAAATTLKMTTEPIKKYLYQATITTTSLGNHKTSNPFANSPTPSRSTVKSVIQDAKRQNTRTLRSTIAGTSGD